MYTSYHLLKRESALVSIIIVHASFFHELTHFSFVCLQDWQHIQLIHVFQDQLVTGQKWSECNVQTGQTNLEAMVDLRNVSIFEEHFYLVVVEKLRNGRSVLHMWRIVISSQGQLQGQSLNNEFTGRQCQGQHHYGKIAQNCYLLIYIYMFSLR